MVGQGAHIKAAPNVVEALRRSSLISGEMADGDVLLRGIPVHESAFMLPNTWMMFEGGTLVGMGRINAEGR